MRYRGIRLNAWYRELAGTGVDEPGSTAPSWRRLEAERAQHPSPGVDASANCQQLSGQIPGRIIRISRTPSSTWVVPSGRNPTFA